MKTFTRTLVLVALSLVVACGGDDPVAPVGNINGTFSGSVEGQSFSGTLAVVAVHTAGVLSITATQTADPVQKQIDIRVLNVTAPGTFSLAPSGANTATYTETTNGNVKTWITSLAGGGGSVVITQLSATHVTGTYTFAAPAVSSTGATSTKNANAGSFSIDIR